MKTIKLINVAMLCMTLTLGACSDGEDGTDGLPGADGAQGPAGAAGVAGADGVSCWDVNGNGIGDAEEDVNNDGNFDALDCQGEQGADGNNGQNGVSGATRTIVDIEIYNGILTFTLPNSDTGLSGAVFEDNMVLYYMTDGTGVYWYQVPGYTNFPVTNEQYVVVSYSLITGLRFDIYTDATLVNLDQLSDLADELHILTIPTGLTGKGGTSKWDKLKKSGIDLNDYEEVVSFLGL